jgi:hypothetical protein
LYAVLIEQILTAPSSVAAQCKAWVCGCSIADSNPAEGMEISLLWLLCLVS